MATLEIIHRPGNVYRLLNVSKSTLQRLVNSGELAQPIRISKRCVGWHESTILEFIASRSKAGAA